MPRQIKGLTNACALADVMLIGLGLLVVSVPLALPLAVLVLLGAFLPYVGAIVSGLLAVVVALAERSLVIALAVLGCWVPSSPYWSRPAWPGSSTT